MGANPYLTDKYGRTAYDYAVERKHHKIVAYLNSLQTGVIEVPAFDDIPETELDEEHDLDEEGGVQTFA